MKKRFALILLVAFCFPLLIFCACANEVVYFDYVSELRNNIFIAEADGLSLRIYSVNKEYPYQADGIPREKSARTEVYVVAPSGDKKCNVSFSDGKENWGGEMSYDGVKAEYYFSCSVDLSTARNLHCQIEYGGTMVEVTAKSVLKENALSPKEALDILHKNESELFEKMTDKYGFTGEIYLRLIYEDSPFYYVGIIDRNGGIVAFLMHAETGKILAKRQT